MSSPTQSRPALSLPGPRPLFTLILKPLALVALVALSSLLSGFGQAQSLIGYEYDADRIDTTTRSSSWRRVRTFYNNSSRYRSYVYEAEKETCYAWDVSRTTLVRYGLGSTQSWCTVTDYTTTVRVAPGASRTVQQQRVESETEYELLKYALYSDGSRRVVSTGHATREKRWENYRVR